MQTAVHTRLLHATRGVPPRNACVTRPRIPRSFTTAALRRESPTTSITPPPVEEPALKPKAVKAQSKAPASAKAEPAGVKGTDAKGVKRALSSSRPSSAAASGSEGLDGRKKNGSSKAKSEEAAAAPPLDEKAQRQADKQAAALRVLHEELDLPPGTLKPGPRELRRLGEISLTTLAARLRGALTAFASEHSRPLLLAALRRRAYPLLSVPTDALLRKIHELAPILAPEAVAGEAAAAGGGEGEGEGEGTLAVLRLLAGEPDLVSRRAEAVAANVEALTEALGRGRDFALSVVRCRPTLVGSFSAAGLRAKMAALAEVAGREPRWAEELAQAGPSRLGKLLERGPSLLARFRFLIDAGKAGKSSMESLGRLSDARFKAKHPEYEAWLAKQPQRQQGEEQEEEQEEEEEA